MTNPMDTQVGGDHYKKLSIQPMEYSMANRLDPCQHTIIKYVTRFRDKGGIGDLEKAKHVIDMLIQFEKMRMEPAIASSPLPGGIVMCGNGRPGTAASSGREFA